jgi:hypothetical protein
MTNHKIGWALIAAGVFLLAAKGELSLLLVLLPVAAVLAYGFSWIVRGHRA